MTDIVVALIIGLITGVASGVAGIGGGVVMIPLMVFILGMGQTVAQGTSTLAILFTSVSGTFVNVRNGRADVKTALTIGIGGAVAAYLTSKVAVRTNPETLQTAFGILLIYSGTRMAVRALKARFTS